MNVKVILQSEHDEVIKDIQMLCKSLIYLNKDNNIEQARIPAYEIWERLK